jgi:hypothetical protein
LLPRSGVLVAPSTLEVTMGSGSRGPVPKRSEERRRRNKPDGPELVKVGAEDGAVVVEMPPPLEHWHPLARDWYESLAESGQQVFYQPSDWQTARYVAEAMSRNLENPRFSAQLFAAVMAGMTELMTTEGARRRARVELERRKSAEPQVPAGVTAMADYRASIGG